MILLKATCAAPNGVGIGNSRAWLQILCVFHTPPHLPSSTSVFSIQVVVGFTNLPAQAFMGPFSMCEALCLVLGLQRWIKLSSWPQRAHFPTQGNNRFIEKPKWYTAVKFRDWGSVLVTERVSRAGGSLGKVVMENMHNMVSVINMKSTWMCRQ